MADTRRAFLEQVAKVAPKVSRAFAEAIQDIRSTAQRRAIEEAMQRAISSGNISQGVREVLGALQLGQEFWAPLDRSIQEAFEAGAVYQLSTLPKKPLPNTGPLLVRFQGRHPRAEAWARETAANLIAEITTDTEVVIRNLISEAVEKNRPFRKVVSELIGRQEGSQRKGGLIGLHSRQAAAVQSARADLETLSDRYFTRKRRDKRFDGMVRRAIKNGQPLSQKDIDKITSRYADRLLRLRAETIARTEANKAMNAGRAEGIVQMIESGKIPADAVSIIWDATPDSRTRDSHLALNGKQVNWGETFQSPVTGALMKWPHDDAAPASETVNCRCSARFRIDYLRVATWRETFEAA